jgi:hypothetical protein
VLHAGRPAVVTVGAGARPVPSAPKTLALDAAQALPARAAALAP